MDNRDWLLLKILYEEKNITKTAERLYISQPAITNRIKQIEKYFNVKIALRGRRGITFTPQGEYLAKKASKILKEIDIIKENIENMDDNMTGTLKIAVSRYFTKYQLPKILKEFKELYPKVEYKIYTDWSSNVFNKIYNQDVHVGILRGDYSWSDEKHLIFDERICIASKKEIDIKDLPLLPRIDFKTDILIKSKIDQWWNANYQSPPSTYMEVDEVDTCKEMVLHGLGYGIIPSKIINDSKGLYVYDLKYPDGSYLTRQTWMFYQKENTNLKLINTFIEFVKNFV